MIALRWPGVPWANTAARVIPQPLDGSRAGRRHRDCGLLDEFVASGAELVEFDCEVTDPMSTSPLVGSAVLERGQVPVDRGLGRGDLAGDGLRLFLSLVAAFGAVGEFCGDGRRR
ncbi:hypothetical protein [Phytohabitans suffuscus]|uniref:Uncharacterized protein n=1 Tax=Phytohabitans suffuscus TaxID=624315 RepID=A0A6F8YFQ3_9ACTN|nr:hypothetical protein [Phytohabitans suffuscus]BCB84863.1 hypothetical protein Psuf_021760 [Phytohabitans suffuscus]